MEAAMCGHFATVQWAIKNGCPCDEETHLRVEEFAAGLRTEMYAHHEVYTPDYDDYDDFNDFN
jgi:hypothetical protein